MSEGSLKRALKAFSIFLRISSFTLGGGYAMVPVMQWEIDKLGWMKKEEFLTILSAAQSIPGPIAFNTAVLVGKKVAGPLGSILSGIAIALPPFIAIVAVASALRPFLNNIFVKAFLMGTYAAVVGLVLNTLLGLIKRQRWGFLKIVVVVLGVSLLLFNRNTLYAVFVVSILILYIWGR